MNAYCIPGIASFFHSIHRDFIEQSLSCPWRAYSVGEIGTWAMAMAMQYAGFTRLQATSEERILVSLGESRQSLQRKQPLSWNFKMSRGSQTFQTKRRVWEKMTRSSSLQEEKFRGKESGRVHWERKEMRPGPRSIIQGLVFHLK